MTDELFVKIIVLLITILITVISANLMPYVKSKMTDIEYNKLIAYVNFAVRCAEQLYSVNEFREKKAYVMDMVIKFINEHLHLTLTTETIDVIVEGVVNEVKKG